MRPLATITVDIREKYSSDEISCTMNRKLAFNL